MLKICLRLVRIRANVFKTPMESFEPKDSTGKIRHTKDFRRLLLKGQIKGKTDQRDKTMHQFKVKGYKIA